MNKRLFKIVSVAVVCTLFLLAGLQIFWLTRMYDSRKAEFRQKVNAAMERAAYEELSNRNQKPQIMMTNITKADSIMPSHINITDLTDNKTTSKHQFEYTVNMDRSTISITKMSYNIPDKQFMLKYDSLLTRNLEERDIFLKHSIAAINISNNKDSVIFDCENSLNSHSSGLLLSNTLKFDMPVNTNGKTIIRLKIENPNKQLLKGTLGIIFSSILILIILAFSFYYLLRTIFRQKTLEDIKTDFTRNITHELKTPIAVAGAANEALLKFSAYDNPVKRDEYLNVTQQQLSLLADMVERILSISVKERTDFNLNLSGCNIKEIIEELIKNYSIKYNDIPDKKVNFKLTVYQDNLILQLDKFHFTNILSNLIDNAIKYSGKEVDIKIEINKKEILISDNGIGISQQEAKYIFDKFYRVPTGNIHNVKGFGLGLYYSKLIVEKHGGIIEAVSKHGTGSTFKITFA